MQRILISIFSAGLTPCLVIALCVGVPCVGSNAAHAFEGMLEQEQESQLRAELLQHAPVPAGCHYPVNAIPIPGQVPAGKIALTFDDGPDPQLTPDVLDLLKHYGIKSTFFLIGEKIAANEPLILRILAEGHNIGNHSYTHPEVHKLTEEEIRTEFSRTDELLKDFPKARAKVMRFPYGQSTCFAEKTVRDLGYSIVGWSIDSCDWDYSNGLKGHCLDTPSLFELYQNDYEGWLEFQLSHTHGGVILMHDIHRFTIDHLEALIIKWKAQGYEFVSLDDGSFPALIAAAPPPVGEF